MVLVGSVLVRASAETPRGVTTNREYFTIQVVDRQTGRGVPLVELRTTNSIRLFTDSNGIVAFREPGLMDREVFFFVESHGYEVPKDGFGYRGVRLRTTPGQEAIVKIDRLNIAERLYRVTGQGIYRDSVLTGRPVPLQEPGPQRPGHGPGLGGQLPLSRPAVLDLGRHRQTLLSAGPLRHGRRRLGPARPRRAWTRPSASISSTSWTRTASAARCAR